MVKKISLSLSNIKHTYNNSDFILNDINLDVSEGEIVAILGSSGCGKSTLLRLITGLEKLNYGEIEIYGKTVANKDFSIPPNHRNVGLVLQEKVLFPHLSVLENVKFGIKGKKAFRIKKALDLLNLFRVDQYANSYPNNISGGEQQRVAIARAIAPDPQILLMDEPFASLDEDLKKDLRHETKKILNNNNITCILVTHDIEDANSMADRIIKLKDKKIAEET
jgi:iron(III) transport system ATP-binding protein